MKKIIFLSIITCLFFPINTFASKGSTKIEISINSESGNNETKSYYTNLTREKAYEDNSSYKFEYEANYTEDVAKDYKSTFRYKTYLDSKEFLFSFGEGFYKNDRYSGYEYEYAIGPGVGFTILNKDSHKLETSFSLLYQTEKEEVTEKYYYDTTGNINIEYEVELVKDTLIFAEEVGYTRFYENGELYIIGTKSTLEHKITKIFSFILTYSTKYRNIVPEDTKTTDKKILYSLIANF